MSHDLLSSGPAGAVVAASAALRRAAGRAAAPCVALVLTLLAGCASPPPPPPEPIVREVVRMKEVRVPMVEPVDAAGRQLLAWTEEIRTMAPEALQQEAARLGDGGAAPGQGVRLALVLAQLRNPGDLARALQALDAVQRAAPPADIVMDWRPWARWLAMRLQQERRLEEQLDRQTQQVREGQRRIDQLHQTVEALKDIERRLAPRRPGKEGAAR